MNKRQKKRFVKELIRNVAREVLAKVEHMPDEWDGHELRKYIADRFEDANCGLLRHGTGSNRHRIRDYTTAITVHDL